MQETIRFIIIPLVILAWVLWLWLGKRRVKTHRIAILATAIPPIRLLLAAFIYALLNIEALRKAEGYTIVDICGLVSFSISEAAI